MKLKDLAEKYGEQEVLCWAERADESLEWVNIKLEPPKPKTVWDLGKGDSHVIVGECGKIRDFNDWLNCLAEKNARDIGNVFLTKEDALKDIERRKVEALLLKYGGRRWLKKDGDNHYFWVTNTGYGLILGNTCDQIQGAIYFDSKEELTKAIDSIGADRIRDALFEAR